MVYSSLVNAFIIGWWSTLPFVGISFGSYFRRLRHHPSEMSPSLATNEKSRRAITINYEFTNPWTSASPSVMGTHSPPVSHEWHLICRNRTPYLHPEFLITLKKLVTEVFGNIQLVSSPPATSQPKCNTVGYQEASVAIQSYWSATPVPFS